MASYSDIFGKGAMPTFNIGPGHGNTSWKYGGDDSAAIVDAHLAKRAADYADQKAFFQDTTMPALKAWLNPDEPEKDPLEAYLEEEAEEEAAALALAGAAPDTGPSGIDADTGKFDGSPRAEDIRYSWGDMFNPDFYTGKDEANLWSGIADTAKKGANWIRENPWDATSYALMTNPYTALLGYGMTREAIPTAADAVTYGSDSSKHFGKAMDDSEFFQSDLFMHEGDQPGSIERQREINKLDRNMDIDVEDYPYWYKEDDHHGSIAGRYVDERGFEDGGRVGMNTGGLLPWTQTMSSDYANQYYNQFNNPTFGATTATQATTPTQSDTPTGLGNLGSIAPIGVPASAQQALRAAQGRGPEDRGTWDQRFGQDNQYNRPGVHQGVAYESDDDGTLRASYVPSNMTSMSVGDLAPGIVQSVYNVGQLVPKTTGFIADLLGFGKDKDDKEAKALEQAALQKAQDERFQKDYEFEQNRVAAALAAQQQQQFIADTLAAINSGGDGSDNDNTTQTSTSTGGGGSPLAGGVSLGTSLHGGNQYTGGGSHGGGPHSGGGGGLGSTSGGSGPKKKGRRQRKKGSHGGGPHG